MTYKKSLTRQEYVELTERLSALTESEQRLDAYIRGHFSELPYHGIVDLAHNAAISKATIGRFLNKLGFTGYAAFKRALEQTLSQQKITPPFELAARATGKTTTSTGRIVSEFNRNVTALFETFKHQIDIDSLDQFIALILDTDRQIYVVGPSSSHAMAIHFVTLIKYFRDKVTLLSIDIGELPKSLLNISNKDVLIVFSYYRFNRVVINIAKWFRQKEATVVLITNSQANPYGKFCDIQFVLPSDAQAIFQSRIIGFFFIELALYLAYEKGDSEGNFEQLEELFMFFETFSAAP
jgi:DNA-binding MurR/RpiR family transcriptional regulator